MLIVIVVVVASVSSPRCAAVDLVVATAVERRSSPPY
jgi:hypothetical protein